MKKRANAKQATAQSLPHLHKSIVKDKAEACSTSAKCLIMVQFRSVKLQTEILDHSCCNDTYDSIDKNQNEAQETWQVSVSFFCLPPKQNLPQRKYSRLLVNENQLNKTASSIEQAPPAQLVLCLDSPPLFISHWMECTSNGTHFSGLFRLHLSRVYCKIVNCLYVKISYKTQNSLCLHFIYKHFGGILTFDTK